MSSHTPAPPAPNAPSASEPAKPSNFLRHVIEHDLEAGTYANRQWGGSPGDAAHHAQGMADPAKVRMRFPPEPNGYLHIGHAKSIWLNFSLAQEYGGVCHLRFDDTNPEKEEQEYVDSIRDAVQWLGYETYLADRPSAPGTLQPHEYFASDYFGFMYRAAEHLITAGLAYVDEQTPEQMRANRGDFTTPGTDSPFRSRTVEENLARFREMRDGKLDDGAAILRAKIDMASPFSSTMNSTLKNRLILLAVLAAVTAAGTYAWSTLRPQGPGEGFVSGNGRIEATEVDVAAKLGGRVQSILVKEGDFVTAGQPLAHMQIDTLEASHDEAKARHQQAVAAVATAEAQVAVRQSDRQAVLALVAQRQSELEAAQRRLARSQTLVREGASSDQELDDDRARERSLQAAVVAAKAQADAAQAAITAARTQVTSARASVTAALASVARIQADIADSALLAPRSGRVQYRIAQAGEVIGGGGKVLNLVDLSDVYMTFFLPETVAGQLALGSEVRIVLDAAPQLVIPARVSFVASTAQFTPKTVETASERQKMMFRVKAQIAPELLQKHVQLVKTGLPGMAWLKLDANAPWPAHLAVKLPE